MHLVTQPRDPTIPLFFNVDTAVGTGSTASRVDVLLVQFLIRKAAEKKFTSAPAQRARMLKVPLSGVADAATIDAIKAVQEAMRTAAPGTVVDGRVSPARQSAYGGGTFTIVTLNAAVRASFPEAWPRLQDLDGCPSELKAQVAQLL